MKKILIVDDEALILESLSDILSDENYQVFCASDGKSAEKILEKEKINLILLDIWLPETDGISLLQTWENDYLKNTPVIMMSGHGTIETAVEATKLGAYDFLEKPLSTAKLLLTIERALQASLLQQQNQELKEKIDPSRKIIGSSQCMVSLRKNAEALARQKIPLLITGEQGAGKENFAHYIHQQRKDVIGNFISANFAVIDSNEALPVLLGTKNHLGLLSQAQNGTLYINECSLLSEEAQNLLLHIIEKQEYFIDNSIQKVNINFVFASRMPKLLLKNKLLPAFYDSVTLAHIEIPNLNQHSEDVPELLDYFNDLISEQESLAKKRFSSEIKDYLQQYNWHGNIRELKNLVQRLLINFEDEINLSQVKQSLNPENNNQHNLLWEQLIPHNISFRDAREVFEHQYLLAQFNRCEGNIAKLSKLVGMDRTNLYRKLRSVGIDPTLKPE